jgi:hypothetical protein
MTALFYEPPKGDKSGKEDGMLDGFDTKQVIRLVLIMISSSCATESAQYIGIDTAQSRLVHIADYDSSEDELSLRMSMLWR